MHGNHDTHIVPARNLGQGTGDLSHRGTMTHSMVGRGHDHAARIRIEVRQERILIVARARQAPVQGIHHRIARDRDGRLGNPLPNKVGEVSTGGCQVQRGKLCDELSVSLLRIRRFRIPTA